MPDHLPEPWLGFLRDIDAIVDHEVQLHCFGGFVVTTRHGLQRTTADVDVLSVVPHDDMRRLLAFAFANSVISFFQAFRVNFITASTFFIALALIKASTRATVLWPSAFILLSALVVWYVRRFTVVFQPTMIFDAYRRFFPRVRAFVPQSFCLDAEIKHVAVESLTADQLKKWTTNLQSAVLYNRACLFVAKKLQEYQSSKLNFLSYVFSLITLTFLTLIAFAGINLALFKIDPHFFAFARTPSTFAFFYYSFNNMFHSSANGITPALPLSQSVFMLQVLFETLLAALLLSLFFSVHNERYTQELQSVVAALESEGQSMEQFVLDEYSLATIEKAIASLATLKAGLISEIYWFTKQVE